MKTEGKYSSVLVAKYIMAYANDNGIEMNITKLNKLLYALYGVYLALVGERLTDAQPHAWPYGPIFLTLREAFLNSNGFKEATLSDADLAEIQKDEQLTSCLKAVMEYFGPHSASSLVDWTHSEDSPWSQTTRRSDFKWDDVINDFYTKTYFKRYCSWKQK